MCPGEIAGICSKCGKVALDLSTCTLCGEVLCTNCMQDHLRTHGKSKNI